MNVPPPIPLTVKLVGLFGAMVLRLIGLTWRYQIIGEEHFKEVQAAGKGNLFVLWHEAILPLTYGMRNRGFWMLVSQHRDGEYITQVLERFGYNTVRGSSTRGGYRSLIKMARLGKTGQVLGITPDGPNGPRRKLQGGFLVIAQRGDIPILPIMAAARPCRRLASWDRFMIPYPFARVVITIGEPIWIGDDLKPDQLQQKWQAPITDALNKVTALSEQALAPDSAGEVSP